MSAPNLEQIVLPWFFAGFLIGLLLAVIAAFLYQRGKS